MQTFIKSIGGGDLIGLGCTIYLSCPNKIVGAFLFSIGLLMICYYQLNLYTGKVGYVFTNRNIRWNIIPIYFGNFIGAGAVSLPIRYIKPELVDTSNLNL